MTAGGEGGSSSGGPPPRDIVAYEKGTTSERQPHLNDENCSRQADIGDLLAGDRRVPIFLEGMTVEQLEATQAFTRPAGKAEVNIGAYFSDRHTDRMARRGEAPLDSVLRLISDKLPNEVAVAVGTDFGVKQPGRAAVSYSIMRTYSRGEFGSSVTMGFGGKPGSVFITVSGNTRSQELLVGGSVALGGAAVQIALNITEALNGTLAYETGLSVPIRFLEIDAGALNVDGNGVVELSIEVRPAELIYETFVKVLGPLTDYRNFVDPISRY